MGRLAMGFLFLCKKLAIQFYVLFGGQEILKLTMELPLIGLILFVSTRLKFIVCVM